jgi:hypothetical protein
MLQSYLLVIHLVQVDPFHISFQFKDWERRKVAKIMSRDYLEEIIATNKFKEMIIFKH